MEEHIVIGAGIAGLYRAYLLKNRSFNPLILEKSKTIGGRVKTINRHGTLLECGAAIIHSNQKHVSEIIHDFNLELLSLPPSKTVFMFDMIYNVNELWDRVKRSILPNKSLREIAKMALQPEEYKFIKNHTREWYEICHQNASTYFQGLSIVGDIYKIKDGNYQMITHLMKNQRIELNTKVMGIKRIKDGYEIQTSNQKILAKNVHLCINVQGAKHISYQDIPMIDILNMLRPIPTLRIFVIFNKTIPWKEDAQQFVSDKPYKWAIVMSSTILQSVYIDGKHPVSHWTNRASIQDELLKSVQELTLASISKDDIEDIIMEHWKEGFCIVKSHILRDEYQKKQNLLPMGFHETVSPKDYGLHQAWMESHLKSL